MRCISRITDDTYSQHFANGRNKFFVEFRCGRPCINELDVCAKCFEKNASCKLQDSRKFNHGKINEPIPDTSHIYGGKWFYESAKKWGMPPAETIQFALQYQKEARGDYVVEQPSYESYKDATTCINKEMSSTLNANNVEPVKRRGRKPRTTDTSEDTIETNTAKRTRKPKITTTTVINSLTHSESTEVAEITQATEIKPKKSTNRRKKLEDSAYSAIINSTKSLVHKEVVLPTHIESSLELCDTDGYAIEYIHLTPFEANGITYYRDSIKNKLYKKIKDKIGEYIGRWNPDNETIHTEVPDSDAE